MSSTFQDIPIAGGDTAVPQTMAKRLGLMDPFLMGKTGRFLDCGCGGGSYVLAIQERYGLETHGVEHEQRKVDAAWLEKGLCNRVRQGDLQALDIPDNSWDFALLNEVLEHVPDDRAALREVHRILKPGGYLFLFSPNRCFPFETHGVYWKSNDRPVPHWLPGIPYVPLALGRKVFRYWARNYWPRELGDLAEAAGFEITERFFLGLTFENISGRQPILIRWVLPLLRAISNGMEHCPGLRSIGGVSQVLICRKTNYIPSE